MFHGVFLTQIEQQVKSPGDEEECLAIAMSYMKGRPILELCQEMGSKEDSGRSWYPIMRKEIII